MPNQATLPATRLKRYLRWRQPGEIPGRIPSASGSTTAPPLRTGKAFSLRRAGGVVNIVRASQVASCSPLSVKMGPTSRETDALEVMITDFMEKGRAPPYHRVLVRHLRALVARQPVDGRRQNRCVRLHPVLPVRRFSHHVADWNERGGKIKRLAAPSAPRKAVEHRLR